MFGPTLRKVLRSTCSATATACSAVLLLTAQSDSVVIRTSQYPTYQRAVDACTGEDLLLFDDEKDGQVTNPPSGLQVAGPL